MWGDELILERLDKIISNLGYGSRKEVKGFARKGLIEVDGEIIKDSSTLVDPERAVIKINGEEIFYRKYIYLLMNKNLFNWNYYDSSIKKNYQ